MIDIHSHILFGIDDGSRNIEESLEILRAMEKQGFTDIICTPHYHPRRKYLANNTQKSLILKKLKSAVKKSNIKINLSLGNEVFIHPDIMKLIKSKKIKTIKRKYLLFELSFYEEYPKLKDALHQLKVKGYIPILAHPERYTYFQKDKSLAVELKKSGLLFQLNYGSLLGVYGFKAKRLAKFLLKNGYIDFLGSDIHRSDSKYLKKLKKADKKVQKIVGTTNYAKIQQNLKLLV